MLTASKGEIPIGNRKKELPRRSIHLGIDYGTSWSKLVFRDYDARGGDHAVVVRFGESDGGAGDYRIPSLVSLFEGRLRFGWDAYRSARKPGALRYPSMKVQMAFPDAYFQQADPLPPSLSAEDLATLTVLFLLQRGRDAATAYANGLSAIPQLSMTLGVPMSQVDNIALRDVFVGVGRTAFKLLKGAAPDLRDGIEIQHATTLLRHARTRLREMPTLATEGWVRSEAVAALLWTYRSPNVPGGLYAAVDVGAGSTSASWFRIVEVARTKERMAFFGASCHPRGADAVEFAIAKGAGIADMSTIRGQANKFWPALQRTAIEELERVCDEIFDVYGEAFGRAYPKDRLQSHWFGANLFLLGGGCRIDPVRARLMKRAWVNLDRDPPALRSRSSGRYL